MQLGNSKVIALTSGKGGVGKTLLTAELALFLASRGKKILLIDGDVGLANIDIFFSVKARGYLYQVISGDKKLNEIITQVAPRVDLVSAGNGNRSLNKLSSLERRGIIASLIDLQFSYDFVFMDTSSGLSEFSIQIASMADMIINILTPDPASFTDSYSLIKLLNQDSKIDRFMIMTNFVQDEMSGALLFKKFADVTGRFLILSLDYVGSVVHDGDVARATQSQKLWYRQSPTSPHAVQINKVGENILLQSSRLGEVSQFWTEINGVA